MASGNKKQIRDIYKRIDGLAASLRRGAVKASSITREHEEAIRVLAAYVAAALRMHTPLSFVQRHRGTEQGPRRDRRGAQEPL